MILPVLAALLFVGVPLLLSPFDFWDGRILAHALDTGQNDGVHNWFTTSGWHLQYLLFTAVQNIAEATGLSGALLLRLIALGALCGLVIEAERFSARVVGLPAPWASAVGIGTAVFPTWSTLLSSVLFIYVLCAWLVLLALRLIHQRGRSSFVSGLVLLVISFQMNSNFVFAVALALAYPACAFARTGRFEGAVMLRSAIVLAVTVIAFVSLRLAFTPSGLYADYNSIAPPMTLSDLLGWVIEILRYFQYVILFSAILVLAHLAVRLITPPAAPSPGARIALLWPALLGAFLVACAAFPYVVVGKAADIRLFTDWNQRHTMLLAMPSCLFVVSLARFFWHWSYGEDQARRLLPIALAILAMGGLQMSATLGKFSRAAYEEGLVIALRKTPAPPPGIVEISAPQMPAPHLRFYESNWLLYRAYGREDWFSQIPRSPGKPVVLPSWLAPQSAHLHDVYKSKHIMRSFRNECRTGLEVAGPRYGISEVIAWILGADLRDQITLRASTPDCPAPAS